MFDTYYRPLCNFADRYLENDNLAEDFVQETFVYLWQNQTNFMDEVSTKVFLYRTVKNKCLNQIKHLKIKHEIHNIISDNDSEENLFERNYIKEETIRLFYEAIKTLPESCRSIIELAIKGLSNPEIAEELKISVNTVKTHKKTAYNQLRIKLKDVFPSLIILFKIIN